MIQIPPKVQTGDPIEAEEYNQLIDLAAENRILESDDIVPVSMPHGTSLVFKRRQRKADANTSAGLLPFQIYRHDAATPDPLTDWRNVRVHIGYDSPTGFHPDNDDTAATESDRDFLVPASSTRYFWLEFVPTAWDLADNLTINFGSALPAQPEIDACDTVPTAPFIIPIGSVVASDDTDKELTINQILTANIAITTAYPVRDLAADTGSDPIEILQRFRRQVLVDGTIIAQSEDDATACDAVLVTVVQKDTSDLPDCV